MSDFPFPSVRWDLNSFYPQKAGGVTETTEEKARVIVVPNQTPREAVLFKELTHRFAHNGNTYIEGLEWVRDCLKNKKYEHSLPEPRNMGGAKPGAK